MLIKLPKQVTRAADRARANIQEKTSANVLESALNLLTGPILAAEQAIDKDGNVSGAAMRAAVESLERLANAEKIVVSGADSDARLDYGAETMLRKIGRFEAKKPTRAPSEAKIADGRTIRAHGCRIMRTARDSWAIRTPGRSWIGETETIAEAIHVASVWASIPRNAERVSE